MNYKLTKLKPFGVLLAAKKNGKSNNIQELNLKYLRELFQKEQLIVLRGFHTFKNSLELSEYCETWGEVSVWPFGKVLELIEQDDPQDHIFDNSYVPMHWDGMYRPHIPEFQIFHCVTAPLSGQGGRTTFSNTILAIRNANIESQNLWQQVTGIYQRKMEFYNSKVVSPLIVKHPYRDSLVIRYNEPPSATKGNFVNPPDLAFTGIEPQRLNEFHQNLQQALYSPSNYYSHEWQNGDVVIADNFSLLHGREQFVAKSPRHIQRVHVLSSPVFNNPGLEYHQ